MEIHQEFVDAMVAHALEDDPDECCGLLATKDSVVVKHYRMTNAERSPYRYSMDDKELFITNREIEDSGWEMGVIYHSHTHSPAYPSQTDVRLAFWPGTYYLLLSLGEPDGQGQFVRKDPPELRIFLIEDGQVTEEPLVIS